jgi:hypothetical protein
LKSGRQGSLLISTPIPDEDGLSGRNAEVGERLEKQARPRLAAIAVAPIAG